MLVDFGGLQARSGKPGTAFDGAQGERMGHVFLAMHAQAQTGAIEKATLRIQPRGAHRIVKGIHLVTQLQGLAFLASDVPLAFLALVNCKGFTALCGL